MGKAAITIPIDILQPLRVLSDADNGRLLMAMLEYGEQGMVPDFDGVLAVAWAFIQPKLDSEDESCGNITAQRRYAAFCKKRSALNLPKISFEEWKSLTDEERERLTTAR